MVASLLLGTILALLTTVPLAWKWQLGVRRASIFIIILAVFAGLIVAALTAALEINRWWQAGLVWFLAVAMATGFVAYRFFRDPERHPPERDDVLVSPADGTVIYIRESRRGVLPIVSKHGQNYALQELTRTALQSEDAIVIGIAMNFVDVHVNRAPIAGRITFQQHFPGRFGSLRREEMIFENERATTVIERNGQQIAVVQIASRLVRQIVAFVHEGQDVALAQRIGAIRFGSQVDLVVPAGGTWQLMVQPGEHVKAGHSIIAVVSQSATDRQSHLTDGQAVEAGT